VWRFFLSVVLLTVMIPVGATGHLTVYDTVFTKVFLPATGESSDQHPANIARAASIYTVDEEAAFPSGFLDSEQVTWRGCHVSPGIFSQSLEFEPVHVV